MGEPRPVLPTTPETDHDKVSREREFHNQWASSIQIDELLVREAFESPTAIENHFILNELGNLKEKKLLDLGCGAGESSVYLALQGAQVYACDIAENFLPIGRALASKFKVEVNFNAASAGALPYPDDSFDVVYGNGVLHHVDLESASAEVFRVLKPGGKAVFIEPLPYNPAINVYRWMARDVRTEDEQPLTYAQIRSFCRPFSSFRHEEFWFFSLLIFFHFFFVRRWHPSKVRYWKKVIEAGEEYRVLFSRLQSMDRWTLRLFPFLKPLCWNSVIVVQK